MNQQVREDGAGTRVELDLDYELPGGMLGDAINRGGFVERRNEREADHSLQNLKDLLDTGRTQ